MRRGVRRPPPSGRFGHRGIFPSAIWSAPLLFETGPLVHLEQEGGPEISEPRIEPADIGLRGGQPEDAPKLAVVFASAWRDAYRAIVSESSLMSLDETKIAEWLRKMISIGDSTTTVAESSANEVAGFCPYDRQSTRLNS